MAKPFFERLHAYYSSVGSVLRGEAAVASIFPNSTDVGISRERVYAEVLRLHVPPSCNISYGGFLFDQDGNESKQIDVLITDDSSLQFNFHNRDGSGKSFACIDGCIAVASIKSKLDSTQLIESLENIASLPNKQPLANRVNPALRIHPARFDDWPYKIIYASHGVSVQTIMATLHDYYAKHPEVPIHKRPNVIHVAGEYLIIRIKIGGGTTRDGTVLEEHSFHAQPDQNDAYALLYVAMEIQEIAAASKYIFYKYGLLLDNMPF